MAWAHWSGLARTYWCGLTWAHWRWSASTRWNRLAWADWGGLAGAQWRWLTRTYRGGLAWACWSGLAGAYRRWPARTCRCRLTSTQWSGLARTRWGWLTSARWGRLTWAHRCGLTRTYWSGLAGAQWRWLTSARWSGLARTRWGGLTGTYWCRLTRTYGRWLAITYWNWRLIWRDLSIKHIWNQTIHCRTCSHRSTRKSSSITIVYLLQLICSKGYTSRAPRCLFGECFPCNCKSNSPTWSHSIYRNRLICETTFFVKETFLNSRCLRANLNRNLYFIRTSIWISYHCSQRMPTSRQIRIGSRFPSIGCLSTWSYSCSWKFWSTCCIRNVLTGFTNRNGCLPRIQS